MKIVNISSCDIWHTHASTNFIASTSMNLHTLKNRLIKLHKENVVEVTDMESLKSCDNINNLISNYQSWIDYVLLDTVNVEM